MHQVFDDRTTQDTFRRDGYVVLPFLGEQEVGRLVELHATLAGSPPADFYATVFSRDADHRRRVSDGIASILSAPLSALFPRHELCFAVFVTKRPNTTQGALPLHRDYSFADAARHTAVHLWCPLIDVDETNGCLQVVKGSYTLVDSPYAVNEYPPVFGRVMDVLRKDFTTAVPMAAGSLLAYESRLFHGSGENRSTVQRPALVAILLPTGVRPLVYVWNGARPTRFDVLEVTREFLVQMERGAPIRKPYPAGVTYLTSVDRPVDPLGPEDLVALAGW